MKLEKSPLDLTFRRLLTEARDLSVRWWGERPDWGEPNSVGGASRRGSHDHRKLTSNPPSPPHARGPVLAARPRRAGL